MILYHGRNNQSSRQTLVLCFRLFICKFQGKKNKHFWYFFPTVLLQNNGKSNHTEETNELFGYISPIFHQDFVLFQETLTKSVTQRILVAQAGKRSSVQTHEYVNSSLTRENLAWESVHLDPGTHSVDAAPINRRAIKHILTQVQAFHGGFFFF